MDSTDTTAGQANSRLERTRDEARARRLHPPLRARLSQRPQELAERPLPGATTRYAAALREKGV